MPVEFLKKNNWSQTIPNGKYLGFNEDLKFLTFEKGYQ